MKKKYKYIIGIDEVGRGPLAGPVAVAGVLLRRNFQFSIFNFQKQCKILNGIRDSKKLSAKKREEWEKKIKSNLPSEVVFVGQRIIDKKRIVKAMDIGIKRLIKRMEKKIGINPNNCFILLDGSLRAPKEYEQKTIIKGDEKIPLISAASIVAKVARDSHMMRLHKKFPAYYFDKHKGYGTKLHYKMLKKYGVSKEHRKSFLKKLIHTSSLQRERERE